jgi:hypothetical protein
MPPERAKYTPQGMLQVNCYPTLGNRSKCGFGHKVKNSTADLNMNGVQLGTIHVIHGCILKASISRASNTVSRIYWTLKYNSGRSQISLTLSLAED